MKNITKVTLALILMIAGLSSGLLLAQDAATPRFAFVANNVYRAANSASVFQLTGGSLLGMPALETTGWGLGGTYFATKQEAVTKMGSNVCVFVADPGSDDIASFSGVTSSPVKVGNYVDASGSGAYLGTTLVVHGSNLFSGYTASVNIGVWTINSDCSLTLASPASNAPTPAPVDDMAVTPDGSTLIASYAQTTPGIGTFAISGSTLTPVGSYNSSAGTAGIDITKDGKYAVVGEFATFTQVEVFPINPGSTLGASTAYSYPQGGFNSNNVVISPDQTRVYIANNNSFEITTLSFNESAAAGKQLQFFCLSSPLKPPPSSPLLAYISGVATADATGKGGHLYVVEAGYNSVFAIQGSLALMQIPADTCPSEVSGSPFALATNSEATSVSAYPAR